MSQYEIEHNIPANSTSISSNTTHQLRRPDLSSFFSALSQVDTTSTDPITGRRHSNPHAIPIPSEVEAVFRLLAEAIHSMGHGGRDDLGSPTPEGLSQLQSSMISTLLSAAENPPKEIHGVSDSFLDGLERVPKTKLRKDMECPICGEPFLDDPYPLVVRLPCNEKHVFDLECIRPWLKVNPTCPLDRKEMLKEKKKVTPPPKDDEEMEEYDDFYA